MAYPNLKRLMLIYGHTPTPPPPATLTQEQLARDAGQLVQAHAALDKLVSDTDRSANSLLDRIQQVVNCTEQVNKVLDSAGLPKNASIVESVETLKRRCDHHAKVSSDRAEEVGKLQLNIHDLKARNRRLHDAQAGIGIGSDAAADQINEELVRMRASHKVAPDAAHCVKTVEECVRKLNEANVICVPLPDRIQHLLDERAAVRRDLLNLAAVTATADSNRTLAARAVNRVTTMEKTIVAFANSPSVKELL